MKFRFPLTGFLLGFIQVLLGPGANAAAPALSIQLNADRSLTIEWSGAPSGYDLEQSDTLTPVNANTWRAVPEPPTTAGDRTSLRLQASDQTRFFRLHPVIVPALTIASRSPDTGEVGVAVTRETILRLSGSLAPDTVLDSDRLYALAGGRRMLSRAELNTDRTTATLFFLETLPPDSRVEVVFDGTGLFDDQNRPVDLDGDGVVGGWRGMFLRPSPSLPCQRPASKVMSTPRRRIPTVPNIRSKTSPSPSTAWRRPCGRPLMRPVSSG